GEVRTGRHEQRVKELLGSVERFVSCDELDGELVVAGNSLRRGDDEMPVGDRELHGAPATRDREHAIGWLFEVQYHIMLGCEHKADDLTPANWLTGHLWNHKVQVVPERSDCPGTLTRQRFRT